MADTIFISIAAYCDPLLRFTIANAFSTAKHPGNLYFGVIDQSPEDGKIKLEGSVATRQVRYTHVLPKYARGACWARSLAMSLYQDETWYFQIDSHMLFDDGWDEKLIDAARQCQSLNPRCIISSYPNPFELEDEQPVRKPVTEGALCHVLGKQASFDDKHLVLSFQAVPFDTTEPVRGFHVGAGCLFAPGQFVYDIPYDPHFYFHGEEQAIACKAFTHGWDIFHIPKLPIYHLYNTEKTAKLRPLHWTDSHDTERPYRWWMLEERSQARLTALLLGSQDLGRYQLGKQRSLAEYTALSGIDYLNKTLHPRAYQGYWAPGAGGAEGVGGGA